MKKEQTQLELSVPQQNYVEAIDELAQKHGHAHCVEIARLLGVKKPSVTEAVNRLVALKVATKAAQEVVLTEKGRGIASELAHRHETLRRFMVEILEMSSGKADAIACRIEHTADHDFIRRLLLLDEFMQSKEMATCKEQWRDFRRRGGESGKQGG
jgi:DtxR family Mn-dependent transcriptional regulator